MSSGDESAFSPGSSSSDEDSGSELREMQTTLELRRLRERRERCSAIGRGSSAETVQNALGLGRTEKAVANETPSRLQHSSFESDWSQQQQQQHPKQQSNPASGGRSDEKRPQTKNGAILRQLMKKGLSGKKCVVRSALSCALALPSPGSISHKRRTDQVHCRELRRWAEELAGLLPGGRRPSQATAGLKVPNCSQSNRSCCPRRAYTSPAHWM